MTELCIVHSGPLPPSVWGRLRAHLGTPTRVLDLETIMPYCRPAAAARRAG